MEKERRKKEERWKTKQKETDSVCVGGCGIGMRKPLLMQHVPMTRMRSQPPHTHLRDSEVGIVNTHLHLTPLKDEELEIGNDRAAFRCTHRRLNS